MKLRTALTAAALVAASVPAYAQSSGAGTALANSFKAEHEAWKEDVNRWEKEHDDAVRALKEALDRFKEETTLDRHVKMIEEHDTSLGDDGLVGLSGRHARTRSQHEEMRETHHHLMDAIFMVVKAIEEGSGLVPEDMMKGDKKAGAKNDE